MRRPLHSIFAGVLLVGLAAPVEAADLALKRVVLSTGGVGYFEYEARVEGNATLALDVPLDQVDDVLKSLVDLRQRRQRRRDHAARARAAGAELCPTCRSTAPRSIPRPTC